MIKLYLGLDINFTHDFLWSFVKCFYISLSCKYFCSWTLLMNINIRTPADEPLQHRIFIYIPEKLDVDLLQFIIVVFINADMLLSS